MTVVDIEPAPTVDSAQPWPGLDAFSEALSPYFFGREGEAEDLFRRVRRDLATLLFGRSGLGKTSLLQAGLFPRLRRAGLLPILVRLDHSGPLEPQVKEAIARECANNLAEATPIAADENLWQWLHRADRRLVGRNGGEVAPVLGFDQFEEMFTTGLARDDRRAESQAFLTALAELIENRPPAAIERAIEADPEILDRYLFDRQDYRIVIALREDFLAPLESLRARAPSLGRNRHRLRPMAGHQGIEAILKPAPGLVPPEVADEIISFVGRANPGDPFGDGTGGAGIEVEPSLLSLFCRELNERRLVQGLDHIDAALLAGSRDEIIADFYERTLKDEPPALRAFVEDELLSDSGYRELYSLDRAYRMLAAQDVPAAALDRLVERRLLHIEERLGVKRIEIIHDVLAPVIRKSREARQASRREAEAVRRQRLAEEEAARREAELRRERRHKRLAYAMLTAMAVLVSVAAGLAVVAHRSSVEAARQSGEAQKARKQAEEQRDKALVSESRVLTNMAETELPNNPELAGLVARTALPTDMRNPNRPPWPAAIGVVVEARSRDPLLAIGLGHIGKVSSALFSPDGAQIVTSAEDKSARLWDAKTGAELAVLNGHRDTIWSAEFSRDGGRIVTASSDKTARLWDAKTATPLAKLEGHTDEVYRATFSPDGERVITASYDHTARLWDAKTGVPLAKLEGHTGKVSSAAFSPDGARILTTSHDHTARLWDAATGAMLAELRGHEDKVYSAAWSPDGALIATASEDGTARLWDAKTGDELSVLQGDTGSVHSVEFSPDGARIVTASDDGNVRLWDVKTATLLAMFRGHNGPVTSATVSPDGASVATASQDHTGRLWDAKSGAQLAVLQGHTDQVLTAAFSADGTRVVTASLDKTFRVWDTGSGETLAVHKRPVNSAAFGPDGAWVVTASKDTTARLWDGKTGGELGVLWHANSVNSAAFSPDGARVVTAASDGTARIWDAKTAAPLAELEGHVGSLYSAAFDPDGGRIVTASSDGTAQIWDAKTGAPLLKLEGHTSPVRSAAFSPDGASIVTASLDKTARIWDARTGALLAKLEGHTGAVLSAAFSPDGAQIVTAADDTTARLWDAKTGKQLSALGHKNTVYSAAFSPDGARIVTASDDGNVRMWDAKEATVLAIFREHKVKSAAFSPDGTRIVTASGDGNVRLRAAWPLLRDDTVSYASVSALRGLTAEERERFLEAPKGADPAHTASAAPAHNEARMSVEQLRGAAEAGNPYAHRRLAERYERGEGVETSLERALFHHAVEARLFEEARNEAEAKNARARRGSDARALPAETAVRAAYEAIDWHAAEPK
jgi:WD40 repeat protein